VERMVLKSDQDEREDGGEEAFTAQAQHDGKLSKRAGQARVNKGETNNLHPARYRVSD